MTLCGRAPYSVIAEENMARKLKEDNKADVRLTVGEIEVLGNIDGSAMQTIKRSVDSLSLAVSTQTAKLENYWRDIASDNLITPSEKRTLRKELSTITQTYTNLLVLAEQVEVLETEEIQTYIAAYNDLYNYLTVTLRTFDDMGSNTMIPNIEEFNAKYDNYYAAETKAQNRVVVMQPLSIRNLPNLSVPGLDGEIAMYRNNLYIYENNVWSPVDKDQYLGVVEQGQERPYPIPGAYFLNVAETYKPPLRIGTKLLTVNEKIFLLEVAVTPGNIYLCNDQGKWEELLNRNDWRYIVAMNDLLEYNFMISPKLQDWLDANLEDVKKNVGRKTSKYLGIYNDTTGFPEPQDYITGDWFTWTGTNNRQWEYDAALEPIFLRKGNVYKFNKPTWTLLDPLDNRYNGEFMSALADIVDCMTTEETQTGYFATIFAKKFMALKAVIEELETKVIELQQGGMIKSQGFTEGATSGFSLGADGIGKFNRVEVYGEINFQRLDDEDDGLLLLPLKRPGIEKALNKKGYIWIE